ncbi:hypothetical protein L1887_00814 [Cichorium endivia]|nr:hypothetical protein L1887_00814 [Cichorium endivia]
MEQTQPPSSEPPPTSTAPPLTTTSSVPSPEQPQQSQPQPLSTTSASSSLPALPPYVNPNPNPKHPNPPVSQPLQSQPPNPMLRTPFSRPWQQNPPPFPHFSSISNHATAPSSSITSIQPPQRGGMAIGVPAHGPSPQPPTSFSSLTPPSFGSQFGGLGRPGTVSVPESVTSTSTPQARQSISGMQGVGMMGSLGSSSSLRPSGVTASHPQRPLQSSLRPQTGANNQSPASQNFQDHGLLRLPSVGSPGTPSPTTPQSSQPHNQPWLSSNSQGKPPLPPPSFRPQISPQSLQNRSHLPQQQNPISTSTNQPQISSSLQPQSSSLSQQPQEHYTLPPSRVPQTLTHQQQLARNRGLGNQRPFAPGGGPSGTVAPPPVFTRPPPVVEASEPCNRIISKRSIHEIVAQIDPGERLDPEVGDILVDIADDFVETITTFACSLAKHRKSNTLESKDILLHLEKNWNMSLPGFGGDEIKCYKKPFGNDVHRERVAAIKKSIAASETPNLKSSGGQTGGGGGGGGGAKGHPAKAPGLVIGSPNPKGRETT